MAESGVPPNGSEAWCWRPSRSTRIRGRSASPTPTYQTQFRRRFPRVVSAPSPGIVEQDVPGRTRLAESERVVEEAHEIGLSVGLVERAAPGDVAGIGRSQVRQEAPAGG